MLQNHCKIFFGDKLCKRLFSTEKNFLRLLQNVPASALITSLNRRKDSVVEQNKRLSDHLLFCTKNDYRKRKNGFLTLPKATGLIFFSYFIKLACDHVFTWPTLFF